MRTRFAPVVLVAVALILGVFVWRNTPGDASTPSCSKCNIILISVDTLDDTSLPQGIVFTDAVAQSTWPLPAQASLLTGKYPGFIGVWTPQDAIPEGVVTLAEVLRSHTYATQAFSDDAFIQEPWGFGRGFDNFADATDRTHSYAALEEASMWLGAQSRSTEPFFLFVRTRGQHDASGSGLNNIQSPESLIKKLLDTLEQNDMLESSVVVVMADSKNASSYDAAAFSDTLRSSDITVPLIFSVPGSASRDVDEVVEIRAIPKTILRILGLPVEGSFGGTLLFADTQGSEQVALTSVAHMTPDIVAAIQHVYKEGVQENAPLQRKEEWSGSFISSAKSKLWHVVKDADDSFDLYHVSVDPNEESDLLTSWASLPNTDRQSAIGVMEALQRDVPSGCGANCSVIQPYF